MTPAEARAAGRRGDPAPHDPTSPLTAAERAETLAWAQGVWERQVTPEPARHTDWTDTLRKAITR